MSGYLNEKTNEYDWGAWLDAGDYFDGWSPPKTPSNQSGGGGGSSKPKSPFSGVDLSPRRPASNTPASPTEPAKFSYDWIEGQLNDQRAAQERILEEGMQGVTGGMDEFMNRYIQMLADMTAMRQGELQTQVGEGRQTIQDATQRAMDVMASQQNPYANLRMAEAPTVVNPLSTYMSQSGASADAVNQLANMLNSSNTAGSNAFQNLASLLGASAQVSAGNRATDVNLATAAALRDLETNRRGLGFQIGRDRMTGEMEALRETDAAKRQAALQALQSRLGIAQQFDQQRFALITDLLSKMAAMPRNLRGDFAQILGIGAGNRYGAF